MGQHKVNDQTLVAVRENYEKIKSTHPNMRARDIAKELHISEAELLASRIGKEIIKLEGDWAEIVDMSMGKIQRFQNPLQQGTISLDDAIKVSSTLNMSNLSLVKPGRCEII